MNAFRLIKVVSLIFLLVSASACTKSGGGDDDSSTSTTQTSSSNDNGERITTDCGVVHEGKLKNPVSTDEAMIGTIVDVVSHNVVILEDYLNPGAIQLVKLHGVGGETSRFAEDQMIASLQSARTVYYYQASQDCETTVGGGGRGTVGHILSPAGTSLGEFFISSGLALPDETDGCGVDQILSCYAALSDTAPDLVGGDISDFLWKPQSERNGTLVVLLNPGGATVTVNGQALSNSGASNGRGTTARGSKSGCAYGSSIKVQAYSRDGLPLRFPNGETTLVIGNGCDRVEM